VTGLPDFVQTSAGRLEFDLAGTIVRSTQGQIKIGKTATFDGTLAISLVPPFQPVAGDAFPLLIFGSATGHFSTIQSPPLAPPLSWTPLYNDTDFTIQVTGAAP